MKVWEGKKVAMGLERFDTVMSFVVVMLLLSMLVTIFVQCGDSVTPLAFRALKGMAGDKAVDSADKAILDSVPSTIATRKDGHDWINQNLPADRVARTSAVFDARFDQETSNRLKILGASFDEAKASLNGTGLQLFGNAGPADMQIAGIPITSGMLVAGLFLSLGAPFWFNALKQLANLRPVIAGKVDQE